MSSANYPSRGMHRPPPPRREKAPVERGEVGTMGLAGVLMVVFGALSMLADLAVNARNDPSGLPARLGSTFVLIIFGLGLIQRVNGVRIFLLLVSGLAVPTLLIAMSLAKPVREIWMLVGAALVAITGYFLLLLQRQASRAFAMTSAGLAVLGSLALVASPLWLVSVAQGSFSRQLADAASTDGDFRHAGSGLQISAPADWVRIRAESSLMEGTGASTAFANPKQRTLTYVFVIEGEIVAGALDAHIDRYLEAQKEQRKELAETARVDVEVAGKDGRRAEITWRDDGQAFSGSIATFAHKNRLFALATVTWGLQTPEVARQSAALEAALSLPGERKIDVEGAVTTVRATCPALSPAIIRLLAAKMPEGAPPVLWFHRAWTDAVHGQALLAPAQAEQLRSVMQEAFATMPDAERRRFGTYSARLQDGLPTTDADELEASRALNAAYGRLSETSRNRFHELTELAFAKGSIR